MDLLWYNWKRGSEKNGYFLFSKTKHRFRFSPYAIVAQLVERPA